jgi:hypothetical protein
MRIQRVVGKSALRKSVLLRERFYSRQKVCPALRLKARSISFAFRRGRNGYGARRGGGMGRLGNRRRIDPKVGTQGRAGITAPKSIGA